MLFKNLAFKRHILMKDSKPNISFCAISSLLIVFVCTIFSAHSSDKNLSSVGNAATYAIGPNFNDVSLTPYLELLEDTEKKWTVDQVSSQIFDEQFIPTGNDSPNYGFSDSAWWVRFTITNPSEKTESVILRQDYPLIDYIDLWHFSSSTLLSHRSTGDKQPFSQREIHYHEYLFSLELEPKSVNHFYMRFETGGATNIGLFLHPAKKMYSTIARHELAYGIYYGGFIVLIVYNLFLFMAVKERLFIYYLLYVVTYGGYMAIHNGLAYQYFWPSSPNIANQSLIVFLSLTLFWVLKFSRSILNIKVIARRTEKISKGLQILLGAAVLVSPFISYSEMIVPVSLLTIITTGVVLSLGIIAFIGRSPAAMYFMTAWITLIISVFIYMAKTFGLLPHNIFTQNAFQVGSLLEMVLLSLALGSRVNELKRQTFTDALTQLFNRRHFDLQLTQEFIDAKQHKSPLSLIVIDIDHFKHFNDTFGHAMGDKALQAVSRILSKNIRKAYIPCRYGGEEFAVILPHTNLEGAKALAERICKSVRDETAKNLKLTISIGVACTEQADFENKKNLFEAADRALYSAKEQGRDRVCDYDFGETRRKQQEVTA